MAAIIRVSEYPVELEQRLVTFDEALSEVEDILKNFQKVLHSDVCVLVKDIAYTIPTVSYCSSKSKPNTNRNPNLDPKPNQVKVSDIPGAGNSHF